MMTSRAYLSIGSNIGERQANLQQAVEQLKANQQIKVVRVSSIYETQPVGGVKQDDFLNIAVAIQTSLNPNVLLDYLHEVEQALHRKRLVRWGPRTIDLDILYFDDLVSADKTLTLPHPEIKNRLFVLVPMEEITADDPKKLQQIKSMINTTSDQNWVRKYNDGGELI
ncbi:2-amino-4-hydroxy-6-hydroxymethyldihydropteridine pyrophosphokinase [Paucilactobacillus hokkaidonensis JCM 18461]|uniref:2-amino-4-hydroxy-6-hydroxymethyldihydropteridine diphosphokinase n=2 Tax=Paucilactobacillus hokkaidonensis TaxID=1193095 RepID=A0A0A1GY54_9LACO|nr:2-amino-4-hydroxy-6-hydroxymethyldihydropteridine pyrophosphokinase [Paucilactobacillus hokkaidonensis JCM 18461]